MLEQLRMDEILPLPARITAASPQLRQGDSRRNQQQPPGTEEVEYHDCLACGVTADGDERIRSDPSIAIT